MELILPSGRLDWGSSKNAFVNDSVAECNLGIELLA